MLSKNIKLAYLSSIIITDRNQVSTYVRTPTQTNYSIHMSTQCDTVLIGFHTFCLSFFFTCTKKIHKTTGAKQYAWKLIELIITTQRQGKSIVGEEERKVRSSISDFTLIFSSTRSDISLLLIIYIETVQ